MGVNSNNGKASRPAASGKVFARLTKAQPTALWNDENDLLAVQALHAAAAAEGILSIGTARGGSGLIITTWIEGEKDQVHVNNAEELGEALSQLLAYWRSVVEALPRRFEGVMAEHDRAGRLENMPGLRKRAEKA